MLEGPRLLGREPFGGADEGEPRAGVLTDRSWVVAVVEGLDGRGADAAELPEALVVALEGLQLARGLLGERL